MASSDFIVRRGLKVGSDTTITGNVTVNGGKYYGDGSALTGIVIPPSYGDSNVTAYLPTHTGNVGGTLTTASQPNITAVGTLSGLVVGGDITPSANVSYDLGSPTLRFRDLYLSGSTINLGGANISASGSGIAVESVSTSGSFSSGNLTLANDKLSSTHNTITIDPSTVGVGGTVVIAGNLQVTGTTTTINSTVVAIDDLAVSLANSAANAAAANGAGILVGGALANLTYSSSNDRWESTKGLATTGSIAVTGGITATTSVAAPSFTGNLSVNPGGSLYFSSPTNSIVIQNGGTPGTGNIASAGTAFNYGYFTNLVGTIQTAAQPNITSLGTIANLQAGSATMTGNIWLGTNGVAMYGSQANGLHFYPLAADSYPHVILRPSGTSTQAYFTMHGSNAMNAQNIQLGLDVPNTVAYLSSGGTGAVPLAFRVAGTERARIATDGTFSFGGNITLSGTGNRIRGDFSNGTLGNRTFFQDATTNNGSMIGVMPNGTGTFSALALLNSSDTVNNGYAQIYMSSTGLYVGAEVSGTGSYVPMYLKAGGGIVANVSSSGMAVTGAISSSGAFTVNSGNGVTAIINGGTNGVGNIGTTGTRFNTVFAQATSAVYADVAENYVADAAYEPGTVVDFGGSAEVTISSVDGGTRVAGVVSTQPAYLMNDGLSGDNVTPVAFVGRVPTKVTGTVRKGDLMVSAGNGRARAEADPKVGAVIGKALADSDGDAVIEVVISRG